MTANELRIGNFINQGEQYGEQPINAYQLYQYSLGGFISSNNIPTYYHYWRPIPLTEEWLVKLPRDLVSEDIPSWIKYVHQLQNWYWMENKCEKELIFK